MNKFMGLVEVDGVKLQMDFNALIEFEDATGMTMEDFGKQMDAGTAKLKDMRSMIHACMLRHQPDATVEDAGELMSVHQDALAKVLAAAMHDVEEVETGKPKPTRAKAK